MPLAAGTKLDSYEILAPLGAGGMGEVYRARDRALRREVAIKVLPSFVSSDPDRLARFEQEAQAAAALNHPNILAIYRFGTFEGSPYLVSELLEGSTLRQLFEHGPLSVRKAIDCGVQIAQGLAAAHEKGIVHRDLKPENLFGTKDGHVKILDFGLVKLIHREPDPHGTATTVALETDPSTVMGTAGYMSPEQVRGQAVDHRTDIFVFGAILYEMLCGRRAFQKPTSAETMAAILNDEPPAISQTGAKVPPALQRVVDRCLEKNPEQRFQSASDLAFALDALSDAGASPAAAPQTAPHRTPARALVWSIAGIAVTLLAAMAYFATANRSSGSPLRISEYIQLTHEGHVGRVIGTDGARLYISNELGTSISQVSVSGGEIEPVSSIRLANPFLVDVSPDGSTLLVTSYEKGVSHSEPLYTVQVVGGLHRYLADALDAAWSPDGKLVAYSTPDGALNIINGDGTGTHKLAYVGDARSISWSPDGGAIRFNKNRALWEITSRGSNLHPLLPNWNPSTAKCCGHWSPSGEFYAFLGPGPAGRNFQIQALDERRGLLRQTSKEPFQLTSGPIDWYEPVFSKDGKKIYATGAIHAGELVHLDSKSNHFQPFLGGISADGVAFSKDHSVAYVSYPDDVLWKANPDGSDRVQLTSPPLHPVSLAWSPDGSQLAFMARSPQGQYQAWIVSAKGGAPQLLFPEDNRPQTDPSWSPDGGKMIFATGCPGDSKIPIGIRILDLASRQIADLPGSDGKCSPRWSPDGQFIAADSADFLTLYVFDVKTQHWSTLFKGYFAYATWSNDSRHLYCLHRAHDFDILRIPAAGGEAKVVVDLKGFPHIGTLSVWFGLDPTDTPLMLRDVSTSDVYALTLEKQ
jgi:eukaryotic-like serine/threonine-protein kinase